MPRPIKVEIFQKLEETKGLLHQMNGESARLSFQIAEAQKQLARTDEMRASLQAQKVLLEELYQAASQDPTTDATP